MVGLNPVVSCTTASLAPGALFSRTIVLDLGSNYPWPGGLHVTATATSDTVDPALSNNSASVNLFVAPPVAVPTLNVGSFALLAALLALVGLSCLGKA